ncbi:sensor domain-containing diguanylate cyclase [Hydrogenovibrio sp. JE_KL2]|uniref:sensor domain-containing diguanylate cyclase n=1 Tax=Hydrogenovibrio sp. JE_KL2 TaxID=2651188 RepID=UPI00128CA71C|nr:sensor domain-containing diguanylate cyclase [Hydrogenovibrio sp. JE_KL2]MPQ77337.1 diguanylate cyclase [Hydrogenovibrio sp. JE_KL2]
MQQTTKTQNKFVLTLIVLSILIAALSWLPEKVFGIENPFSSFTQYSNLILLVAFALSYRAYQVTSKKLIQQNEANQLELKKMRKAHKKEKDRLTIILDSSRIAYWEWNIKKNAAFFSDLWQEMIGFHNHDFPQDLHAWQARIHPSDQTSVQKKMLKLLSNRSTAYEDVHRLMNSEGEYIWVYDRGQTIFSPQGEIERLICVRLDVTQQKQTEEELTLDRTLLDSTSESIAITDAKLNFIRTNPAFHNSFGFSEDELKQLNLRILLDNLQDAPAIDIIGKLEESNEWRGELLLHHTDGRLAGASLVDIHRVHHQTTDNIHYTMVYTDITQLKATQMELDHLAHTDMVTGLPNRNFFYNALEKLLDEVKHKNEKFTVMFLDLDNFKTINDTLGHSVGDSLLRSVSELISDQIAQDTILARVGGDEFVILCRAHTSKEQLEQVGQHLNKLLEKPFNLGGHQVNIGSSIGMAIYPDHGATQTELLQNADLAMYEAKKSGKGQHRIFDPDDISQTLQ